MATKPTPDFLVLRLSDTRQEDLFRCMAQGYRDAMHKRRPHTYVSKWDDLNPDAQQDRIEAMRDAMLSAADAGLLEPPAHVRHSTVTSISLVS